MSYDDGQERGFSIMIAGGGRTPSEREVKNGWEPEFGMEHVESAEALEISKLIVGALNNAQ